MAFIATRTSHNRFHGDDCMNLALRVAKLNGMIDDWTEREHKAKDEALKFLERFQFPSDSATAYKRAFEKWKKAVESRGDSEIFEIEARTRFLAGTGNASVFEFGFNLNYPWGVPFISGSSLKGLVSSYLSRNFGDDWKRDKSLAFKSDAQVELFGGRREERTGDKRSYAGSLIFHDAWLAAWPSRDKRNSGDWFDADIITPHHFRYYGGNGLPDGTENPVPIKMAALRPGLVFMVCIQGPKPYRSIARKILLEALEKEGIGGKTAVGYGRFTYVPTDEEKNLELGKDIENANSAADLLALFKLHKNNKSLGDSFVEALDRVGYSDETKEMFESLKPLSMLRIQIGRGDFDDLKSLNKRFNSLKKQIYKALEFDGAPPLKRTEDGRKLFDVILKKWAKDLPGNSELAVVNNLAYDWEDMDWSDETKEKLVTGLSQGNWEWPPLDTLSDYLDQHPEKFDDDEREIIRMELG